MASAIELPSPSATPAGRQPGRSGNVEEPTRTAETGMWVFLTADLMGFAGLLAAYFALRARAPMASAQLTPTLAMGLTLLLVGSSASMSAAVAASRRGEPRRGRIWLAVTTTLGMAFIAGQLVEFRALVVAPAGGHSTLATLATFAPAAALFFVLTGYHGVHVLVGVVVLARLMSLAPAPESASGTAGALAVASLYWQFVDAVWLVLFAALYLLPLAVGA